MPKKTALPPLADGKWRIDDDDQPTRGAQLAKSSRSSDWLNHASGGPATKDIFARSQQRRKQRLLRGVARGAGKGAALAGRGVARLGGFGYRQMRPMRRRDWITVAALLAVLVAMGAYMKFDNQAASSRALQGCRWHTVEVGDTLLSLAHRSGVSVGDIARDNGVYDVMDPPIGQQICIPSLAGAARASGNVALASQTDGPVIQGEAAFVRFALPYARQAHTATNWPVSVILAQWGLEQGWQAPNFTGYNFGNCGGLIDEPFIPGTAAAGSPSTFAYADTPEDGLRFYVTVAQLAYYNAIAPAASQGGPVAAAKALGASPWDAGHYTDHNDPGSSLVALMQQYNLQQYD